MRHNEPDNVLIAHALSINLETEAPQEIARVMAITVDHAVLLISEARDRFSSEDLVTPRLFEVPSAEAIA